MTNHAFHPMTLDPRSAGQVTRYHSWPRIKDQSVGEHSWQVVRILLAIWPEVPRHVLVYAMYHDVGERVTGDLPYPVKAERPELKKTMDHMEEQALLGMEPWGVVVPEELDPQERRVFKLVEFIEMWEYALDELALGNRNCRLIAERCSQQARQLLHSTPENEVPLPHGLHLSAVSYMQRRINHEHQHRSHLR